MVTKKLIFLVLYCFIYNLEQTVAQVNYPTPEKTDKLLFFFQRSHNKNTIIYDLNTLPNGNIDIDKPVIYYWIRYEEGAVRKDLSFLQRKAFGLQCQLLDKEKGSFILHFNSFKKREIYLLKSEQRYKAFISINGELSELTNLYIESENNSLGVPLTVKFVMIFGKKLHTEEKVSEKYIP